MNSCAVSRCVRTALPLRRLAACVCYRRELHRLNDCDGGPGLYCVGGEMVPSPQLLDGDSEAVSDGDEGVAAANGIALRAVRDRGCDRDYELISGVEAVAEGHAIG